MTGQAYRFETLLNVCRNSRDQSRQEVGNAHDELRRIAVLLTAATSRLREVCDRKRPAHSGLLDVPSLQWHDQWIMRVRQEIRSLQHDHRQAENCVEKAIEELRQAELELRRIEHLHDQDLRQSVQSRLRAEQVECEDAWHGQQEDRQRHGRG